jgi:hypothetical protein
VELGWDRGPVVRLDQDLGTRGTTTQGRGGVRPGGLPRLAIPSRVAPAARSLGLDGHPRRRSCWGR